MTQHSVSVSQLKSPYHGEPRRSFLNVLENEFGGIGVWTNTYNSPTYLFINGNDVYFMQFDGTEFANEWMQENCLEEDGWKRLEL